LDFLFILMGSRISKCIAESRVALEGLGEEEEEEKEEEEGDEKGRLTLYGAYHFARRVLPLRDEKRRGQQGSP
ncbi:hypothetical protein AOQ84DRAFT_219873, partial [Glonium stellatum]